MNFQEFLKNEHACEEATSWVGAKTAEQAWEQCPQAGWVLWLIAHLVQKQELKQEIVRAAADLARRTLMSVTGKSTHDCIVAVERWLAGERVDLQTAIKASEDAYLIDTGMACIGKRCAGWAACAASAADENDPARAVYWTAWIVAGARYCGGPDAQLANIIRKHIPWNLIQPLLERALQEAS